MGKLIYAALTSLDGFIEDNEGKFDWAEPQEDVHSYINAIEAKSSAALYGKKMYEMMSFWEHVPDLDTMPEYIKEYERAWKKMKKFVYSSTLREVVTANTVLERRFVKADIERIKKEESGSIGIGGANLASQALDAGLIDELYQFIFPVMVGNGKPWLRSGGKVALEKLETREFLNGVLMVHYAVRAG